MKVSRPKGLEPIIDLFNVQDSPEFCKSIYKERVLEPVKELTDLEKVEFEVIRK
jgi:hypothetical protein